MKKIAVFGGTFNPPHIGHVRSAQAFYSATGANRLLVIPTHVPPHKEFHLEVSDEDRIEMCRLAFSDISGAEISNMEIRRGGKSYTYVTLEELSAPDTELYFFVGTDMLLTLDEWKNFEKVLSLAVICYVRRENDPALDEKIKDKIKIYKEKYGAKIIEIKLEPLELSSSEIRDRLHAGEPVSHMILPEVFAYIKEKGLYCS